MRGTSESKAHNGPKVLYDTSVSSNQAVTQEVSDQVAAEEVPTVLG